MSALEDILRYDQVIDVTIFAVDKKESSFAMKAYLIGFQTIEVDGSDLGQMMEELFKRIKNYINSETN